MKTQHTFQMFFKTLIISKYKSYLYSDNKFRAKDYDDKYEDKRASDRKVIEQLNFKLTLVNVSSIF
jgi:hypothetical protein